MNVHLYESFLSNSVPVFTNSLCPYCIMLKISLLFYENFITEKLIKTNIIPSARLYNRGF